MTTEESYQKYRSAIAASYEKYKDWQQVLELEVNEEDTAARAFVDLVAEQARYKGKLTAKKLGQLSGLEDIEELEELILECSRGSYGDAIEAAIEAGASWEELLKIKPPARYSPSEPWDSSKQKKELYFFVAGSMRLEGGLGGGRPSPRDVALDLGAPYSEVLSIWEVFNQFDI